ncbi:hypothetical protein ABB55_25350 [Prosthecomicrobium hirschii]|uniref:Uncharacterized protein n=2 Tax=Prosthecodimorpha hirschii TaxID=665126 RepID=A0A0P6W992_9HYPH|nr:hypothetical protein ABB55_25350 [Prosthecomicrobium hirschii]
MSIVFGLSAFPAGPALGVEARSGQETAVHAFYVVHSDCSGGGGQRVAIRTPPAHGSARVALVAYRISEGRRCAGNTVKAAVLYYRPNAGFRGTDTIVIETIYARFPTQPVSDVYASETISVSVR